MPLVVSNDEYRATKQSIRNLRIKINLLNFTFQTVDSLEGEAISGNITIDANADIRRTCTIEMVVTDSTFEVNPGSKIWMNKYIQVYAGIDNLITGETNWTNMGIYLINNPTRVYDTSTNTLSFQALDLMSKLTGIRNGYIEGVPTIIPVGSSIRDSMISVITQLGGFTKYIIEYNPQTVPIEIKVEREATVYDLLVKLRDISPNYEIFFDVNGVFHYQLIPSGKSDPILIDNDIWDSVVTQIETTTEFDQVKNVIEVWGHSHEPSVYVENVTASGSTYSGTAVGLTTLPEYAVIGFVPPSIISNPKLKINNLDEKPILNEDGSAAVIPKADGTYYCVQVNKGGNSFLFLGTQQIYATISETNPDSPFYINGSVGEIRYICTGGEYENIWTNDLALQRAEYELYLHARIMDTVTLNSLPVYWLDVNIKTEYVNEKVGLINQKWNAQTQSYDLPSHYIIKNVSMGLGHGDSMSVTMSRFYPLYPFW